MIEKVKLENLKELHEQIKNHRFRTPDIVVLNDDMVWEIVKSYSELLSKFITDFIKYGRENNIKQIKNSGWFAHDFCAQKFRITTYWNERVNKKYIKIIEELIESRKDTCRYTYNEEEYNDALIYVDRCIGYIHHFLET